MSRNPLNKALTQYAEENEMEFILFDDTGLEWDEPLSNLPAVGMFNCYFGFEKLKRQWQENHQFATFLIYRHMPDGSWQPISQTKLFELTYERTDITLL